MIALWNLVGSELKIVMMHGAEEAPVSAIDTGIIAADTGVKKAFFNFLEMALTDL